MARIVKKISDPYDLIATNGASTRFTVGSAITNNAEVVINGNLVVLGSSTTVESTNTTITDSIITLNKGGTPAATTTAGLEIDRGLSNFVPQLVWIESTQRWSVSNDGVNFRPISTSVSGNYLSAVIEDPNPTLGGDLVVNGQSIVSATDVVIAPTENTQIDSVIKLKELAHGPTSSIAGYNLLYAKVPDGGAAGVYVRNSTNTGEGEELITKRRAIIYSLIF